MNENPEDAVKDAPAQPVRPVDVARILSECAPLVEWGAYPLHSWYKIANGGVTWAFVFVDDHGF